MTTDDVAMLQKAYAAFFARDVEGVPQCMHEDVTWPNGPDGGTLHGREAVAAYWRRRWAEIDPAITPLKYEREADGQICVEVRQVVRRLHGPIFLDEVVDHVYAMDCGLIRSMEIRRRMA